jgi:AraC family transcriptional regulator of adaptative response/methylated-DNA-[protein]-cysteine methyltransferase
MIKAHSNIHLELFNPAEYEDITINFGYANTYYGMALVGVIAEKVCYLSFVNGSKQEALAELKAIWKEAIFHEDGSAAEEILQSAFNNSDDQVVLVKGTEFQIEVWKELLNISRGYTTSYQEIADLINRKSATRAVANAIGANHIAYLIPCHRVIRKSGAIGGYRWGIGVKNAILAHEKPQLI